MLTGANRLELSREIKYPRDNYRIAVLIDGDKGILESTVEILWTQDNKPMRTELNNKKRNIPIGNLNGEIGLSLDRLSERYAYYRDSEYLNFMEKYGITTVANNDPNKTYFIINARHFSGWQRSNVITDGDLIMINHEELKKSQFGDIEEYIYNDTYKVSNASYAVVITNSSAGDKNSHIKKLITLSEDIIELDIDRLTAENNLLTDESIITKLSKRSKNSVFDSTGGPTNMFG